MDGERVEVGAEASARPVPADARAEVRHRGGMLRVAERLPLPERVGLAHQHVGEGREPVVRPRAEPRAVQRGDIAVVAFAQPAHELRTARRRVHEPRLRDAGEVPLDVRLVPHADAKHRRTRVQLRRPLREHLAQSPPPFRGERIAQAEQTLPLRVHEKRPRVGTAHILQVQHSPAGRRRERAVRGRRHAHAVETEPLHEVHRILRPGVFCRIRPPRPR